MTETIVDKKRAILDSTLELIRENGFHGTPMSLVAKRAKVAAGTIYHYFDSKETLICQLFTYVKERILEAAFQQDQVEVPYQERFFKIWKSMYTFYSLHPNELLFFEQYISSPFNIKNKNQEQDHFQPLFDFFQHGMQENRIRTANPKLVAILTHSSALTTAKVQLIGKINISPAELEQIPQILWDGLATRSSSHTPALQQ